MLGLFEITHAIILQVWTFVNSKLKFNGMNGVEGKFKKPQPSTKHEGMRHPKPWRTWLPPAKPLLKPPDLC